jgi:hypothetical protein
LPQAGVKTIARLVTSARGYLSQSELPVTIGLGTTDRVDRVIVKWPGKGAGEEEFAVAGVDRGVELRQGTRRR